MAQRRVYAVLVDRENRRLLMNTKDGLLPPKLRKYEGLICLFGGGMEPGETELETLARELKEELGDASDHLDLSTARIAVSNEQVTVFSVAADLSGNHKFAPNVHLFTHACIEGEASLRTFDWLEAAPESLFVEGFKVFTQQAVACEISR